MLKVLKILIIELKLWKKKFITFKDYIVTIKVKDGIVGLIIGDAMRVPFEFYSRSEHLKIQ